RLSPTQNYCGAANMRHPYRLLIFGSVVMSGMAGPGVCPNIGFTQESDSTGKPEAHAAPRVLDCYVSGPDGGIDHARVTVALSVSRSDAPMPTDIDDGKTLNEAVYTTAFGHYRIRIPPDLAKNPNLRVTVTVRHSDHLSRRIGPVPLSDFDMREI